MIQALHNICQYVTTLNRGHMHENPAQRLIRIGINDRSVDFSAKKPERSEEQEVENLFQPHFPHSPDPTFSQISSSLSSLSVSSFSSSPSYLPLRCYSAFIFYAVDS